PAQRGAGAKRGRSADSLNAPSPRAALTYSQRAARGITSYQVELATSAGSLAPNRLARDEGGMSALRRKRPVASAAITRHSITSSNSTASGSYGGMGERSQSKPAPCVKIDVKPRTLK